ncbi:MAG: tyrosinase family protein [Bacteroidetes bacterium]|nr:tyrosinase family protein [Bacteroidota bacterium]
MRLLSTITFVFIAAFFMQSCKNGKENASGNMGAEETTTPLYVRKNAHSPEAKADLEAMAKALEIMKQMDCSNPASWYYQGGIHWIPDSIYGPNQLCKSYQTFNQLKLAWANCTHIQNDSNSNFHFLIWHRFYTMQFEEIVRSLSGKKDFALPYWDYTNTTDIELNRTLPEALQMKGSPLHEDARYDSLNAGGVINGKAITRNLSITDLMKQPDYITFNSSINQAPHGAMHNYIGDGIGANGITYNNPQQMYNRVSQTIEDGLMADVSTAGFDPVFLDRLWQMWTNESASHLVDSSAVVEHPWNYTFFSAKGDTIQYSLPEVAAKMYHVNYTYNDVPTNKVQPAMVTVAPPQGPGTEISVKANNKISKSNLKSEQTLSLQTMKPEKLMVTPGDGGKRMTLKVTVSFVKEPRGTYEVYLNQPKTEEPSVEADNFIGFINFFGVKAHKTGANATNGKITQSFFFDVSDEFINGKFLEQKDLKILIYHPDMVGKDEFVIENYTLYAK